MVKQILLGIEVDQEVYDQYTQKRYVVPDLGELTLRTVELYADSREIAEKYPAAAAACKDVVEQIRSAITGEAPHDPARVGFSGYIDALHAIYKKATASRADLRQAMDKAEAAWKDAKRIGSERDLARARADFLDAQEDYKNKVSALYESTQTEIDALREQLAKDLKDFYTPSGDRIDEGTQKLLTSGVILRESEVADLFEKYLNNVTMLRLLGDYCKSHKIDFPRARVLSSLVLSDGRNELDIFNRIAAPLLLAVSHNETSVKVWSPENGHFDKYVTEAKNELERFYVKP